MRNIVGFLVGVLLIEAFQKRNATYAKQGQPYKPFLISRLQVAIAVPCPARFALTVPAKLLRRLRQFSANVHAIPFFEVSPSFSEMYFQWNH
jgi:hypothetical protein